MKITISAKKEFNSLPKERKILARKKAKAVLEHEIKHFQKQKNNRENPWIEFLDNIDKYAVDTGIKDLAENHDHYLYGIPKRK